MFAFLHSYDLELKSKSVGQVSKCHHHTKFEPNRLIKFGMHVNFLCVCLFWGFDVALFCLFICLLFVVFVLCFICVFDSLVVVFFFCCCFVAVSKTAIISLVSLALTQK